ncbi:MAG: hypothetical protein EXQ70_04405 [Solirubrobacterales bacterium]|nr:hypothetical protein [Solirubrobacterales bacterium]
MGAQSRTARAGDAAKSAANHPYVRRLVEDEELRDNIRAAFDAARDAYSRMANGNGPAKAVMDDKKVHRDLRTAAESLRDASEQLRGKRRKKRRLGLGRLLLIGILGAGLVLVLSEDARKAVMDRLFGAEEEFEYTSTTTPEPESVPTP